jgi:hypothetical protein
MPLNKFAGFGFTPIARPRPLGLTAVTKSRLDSINSTLLTAFPPAPPPAPTPTVPTPSVTALRIVWSLNAVRDGLSDQGCPSVGATNEQLSQRLNTDAVEDVVAFLAKAHPTLEEPYRLQFRALHAHPDDAAAFDLERRERLAELATFELLVMATVPDAPAPPAPPTPARPSRPVAKPPSPPRAVAAKRR